MIVNKNAYFASMHSCEYMLLSFRADRRRQDELRARNRLNRKKHGWVNLYNYMPQWLMLHYRNKYGILFATATLVVAYLAYMKASEASSLWR